VTAAPDETRKPAKGCIRVDEALRSKAARLPVFLSRCFAVLIFSGAKPCPRARPTHPGRDAPPKGCSHWGEEAASDAEELRPYGLSVRTVWPESPYRMNVE
jgi:hypothetical protein